MDFTNTTVTEYNNSLEEPFKSICFGLMTLISENLDSSESKIWHRHPVWFIDGNPVVGYSLLKSGVRLMFWSGADFNEEKLLPGSGKFMDASVTYTSEDQIDNTDVIRWLKKAKEIQWDYKNLVKRKGVLEKINH